jgi:acetyl-CoA acetyltransferase
VNFAAAQIMSGQHELVIGGGAEPMSRVGTDAPELSGKVGDPGCPSNREW